MQLLAFFVTVIIMCFIDTNSTNPYIYRHGLDLPETGLPLIMGHRGSSGMLPENTAQSFQLAIDQGADAVECDICLTKDLQLVCSHESWLSATTNVADVFPPSRMDTKYIHDQGRNITDYFTVDFTLSELKQIMTKQRHSFRDPNHDDMYSITSLDECIQVVQAAGRPVILYTEIKDPIWVNSLPILQNNGTTFEQLLVNVLEKYGYTNANDTCIVQSFNENSIRNVSYISPLPLIKLYGSSIDLTDEKLQELASFCYGIGPSKTMIVQPSLDGSIGTVTDLVERAHRFGLKVHVYTFRNEDRYLLWNYGQDPYEEYQQFMNLGIDCFITDFPTTGRRFLETFVANETCTQTTPLI